MRGFGEGLGIFGIRGFYFGVKHWGKQKVLTHSETHNNIKPGKLTQVMIMSKFFTPFEIAKMLKVSESTIRRWLREGKLSGVKLSEDARAEWRISEEQFNEFIQDRTMPKRKKK